LTRISDTVIAAQGLEPLPPSDAEQPKSEINFWEVLGTVFSVGMEIANNSLERKNQRLMEETQRLNDQAPTIQLSSSNSYHGASAPTLLRTSRTILDQNGNQLGQISNKGIIQNMSGTPMGTVRGGRMLDTSGNIRGSVDSQGNIYDQNGNRYLTK
jgi:hypothetical protein